MCFPYTTLFRSGLNDLRVHGAGVFDVLSDNARLYLRLRRRRHWQRFHTTSELNHRLTHRRNLRRLVQIALRVGAEFAQAIRVAEVIGLAFVVEPSRSRRGIDRHSSDRVDARIHFPLLFKLVRSGFTALRSELSIKPQNSPSA